MIMSYLFSECQGGDLHHCDIAIWPLLSCTFTVPKKRFTKASHSPIHTSIFTPVGGCSHARHFEALRGQFRVRRKCPCPKETYTCGHLKLQHTKHVQTDRQGGNWWGSQIPNNNNNNKTADKFLTPRLAHHHSRSQSPKNVRMVKKEGAGVGRE